MGSRARHNPPAESNARKTDLTNSPALVAPTSQSAMQPIPASIIAAVTSIGGFIVNKPDAKRDPSRTKTDDVLRRMLATPPKQHEAKTAPVRAKKAVKKMATR